MRLILFSTKRQIRNYLSDFNNVLLDKVKTIGEFFNSIVVVKDRTFIDDDLRKIYLFKAIQELDISKLGFRKEFLSIAKNSEFIFSFLNELFLERVDIDDVIMSDVYVEFEEHLNIIKEIKNRYAKLLEEEGFIDTFLIEDYHLNEGLLEGIDEIEINLDGYLTKFDIEVLNKIDLPVFINIDVTNLNKSLIGKFLKDVEAGYRYRIDFKSLEILKKEKLNSNSNIETYAFSNRFNEINFIFAKIAEMVENGISPEKIGVILPDETLAEKLIELDEFNNLNFAMGIPFQKSPLFKKLRAIYEYKLNGDEISYRKIKDILDEYEKSDLLEFVMEQATEKEKKLIEEEVFKLKIFKDFVDEKEKFLHFIIERFSKLTFDDNNGGKVTCSGVLESRGMEFEGVVIVDFNEGIVPNVNSKDLFLNTFIRENAKLPTRADKENLQKHYYSSLFNRAKEVAIAYVSNEEHSPSRFLYELNLPEAKNYDKKYSEVLFKPSKPKSRTLYNETFEIISPITPSSLKMLIECPKKYYFSKILKIENEDERELVFGTVFHEAVENAVKKKNELQNSDDYFREIMSYIYSKFYLRKNILEIKTKFEDAIKEFCEADFEEMKYSQNIVEEWVNFEFEGKILSSKVDRIDTINDKITLIDYKTSSSVDKEYYDFQMTFYYLWAKSQGYQNIKIYFYKINEEFEKIEPKLKIEELKEALNNLENRVREAEDLIVEDKIVKKAVDICKYCDYKVACGKV